MFRKPFISLLLAAAVIAVGQITASAQDPIRGVVQLKKADGTIEPVAGASIELYRVDIKGGGPSGKTNKKGEFNFVGLLFGGTYAMTVSAPNCEPTIESGIKMGQENIKVILNPGDGRKWTEAEVRQAVTQQPKSDGAAELTAAQKKEQEDRNKEVDEHNAKVLKAQETNKTIGALIKEGDAAFKAKNYDVAIEKFDAGYRAEPTFAGSAPVLLTNKGIALKERGDAAFNSRKSLPDAEKPAALQKAQNDYKEAMAAYEKALEIFDKAADPKFDANRLITLEQYVVLQGAMAISAADPAKTGEATTILDKYIAAETSDAKELPIIRAWAKSMAQAFEPKNAIHAYRIILSRIPDDLDATQGLGSALWVDALAVDPPNEAQVQEGINLLQKFIDAAPDNHPMKLNAKETIESAKETTKLTPKKTTPAKKRG